MREKIMVNVWVYTSMLEDWFVGREKGYLYPAESERRHQTHLLVPYEELQFYGETEGTCSRM